MAFKPTFCYCGLGSNHIRVILPSEVDGATFAPNEDDFVLTKNGVPMTTTLAGVTLGVVVFPQSLDMPNTVITVDEQSDGDGILRHNRYRLTYRRTDSVIKDLNGNDLVEFSMPVSTAALFGYASTAPLSDVATATSGDDAYQDANGSAADVTSAIVRIASSTSAASRFTGGFRIPAVYIPKGVRIVHSHLVVHIPDDSFDDVLATIYGHAADNSAQFVAGPGANDVVSRTHTAASVAWSGAGLGGGGTAQFTPDLSSIIQEIIDRPGWVTGGPLTFIIAGDNSATARDLRSTSTDDTPAGISYMTIAWTRRHSVGVAGATPFDPLIV